MKAEDLRIGNLIYALGEAYSLLGIECIDNLIEAESLKKYEIPVLLSEFSLDNVTGIPLTEDWLLRFGFKPIGDSKDYCLKALIVHKRVRGWVMRKSFQPINYVHQLQNLYYALTGTEL